MARQFRGVSPVVATALLVLIAVATAALLYLWVSGTVQNLPQNSYQMQERIKIDAVKYEHNTTHYNFTVYVRNVGDTPVNISTIYILNSNNTVIYKYDVQDGGITPGSVKEIDVTGVPSDEVTEIIQIKVVTANGVEASYVLSLRS